MSCNRDGRKGKHVIGTSESTSPAFLSSRKLKGDLSNELNMLKMQLSSLNEKLSTNFETLQLKQLENRHLRFLISKAEKKSLTPRNPTMMNSIKKLLNIQH